LKRCCILQDHYDDERNKTVFHNTTPDLDLQDQDHNTMYKIKTDIFGLRPVLS